MRERLLHWLLLLAALTASVFVARRGAHVGAAADVEPLSAVPAGPGLLVTVDVSALGHVLGAELADEASQLFSLRATCHFEPLGAVRQLAFAMPFQSPGADGDFAVIAATSLAAPDLLRCAEQMIRQRGGSPTLTQIGSFSTLRDAQRPLGEVGVRADGLLVVSGGQYFRDAIDAAGGQAHGDERAKLRSELHAELRNSLGPAQLKLTFLPGADSPLPGVRAAALSANVEQRDVELHGFVGCDTPSVCSDLQRVLTQGIADLARDSGVKSLQLVGVEQRETRLEARAHVARAELLRVLRRLLSAPEPK